MSTQEAVAGMEFIYATLTGDTTLMALVTGVYRGMASDQAIPPFVVISYQAGSDTVTANAVRLMTRALYQVTATGPAGMSPQLATAAARIDDLLKPKPGGISGSVPGGQIDSCYREAPLLRDLPPENAVMWSAIGGMYRLEIQQI